MTVFRYHSFPSSPQEPGQNLLEPALTNYALTLPKDFPRCCLYAHAQTKAHLSYRRNCPNGANGRLRALLGYCEHEQPWLANRPALFRRRLLLLAPCYGQANGSYGFSPSGARAENNLNVDKLSLFSAGLTMTSDKIAIQLAEDMSGGHGRASDCISLSSVGRLSDREISKGSYLIPCERKGSRLPSQSRS